MQEMSLEDQVYEVIADEVETREEVEYDTLLKRDLGYNIFRIHNLVLRLEECFDIAISEVEHESWAVAKDVFLCVEGKMSTGKR